MSPSTVLCFLCRFGDRIAMSLGRGSHGSVVTLLVSAMLALAASGGAGDWTWVKGLSAPSFAVYGTQGVADPANTPGQRSKAVTWRDAAGNLWLFGGLGYAADNPSWYLNDLWKFDVATGNWTWMKGSNALGQVGTYGTQGVADPANTPGARRDSVSWTDSAGNLWLFGGYAASDYIGYLNDLWKYDVATGNWTWMKGSNALEQVGTYGTQGVADPANTPGARYGSVSWTDNSGNLWLFGGHGLATSSYWRLNDLWMFDVASGNWTWIKGSNESPQSGTYGTQGVANSTNTPGARYDSVSWTDNSGNLWLFGGRGYAAYDYSTLGDLWKYDVTSGNWTWMKGSNGSGGYASYGTQGIASSTNKPGGRQGSVSWTDSSGNLWLFGGERDGRYFNDLWKYDVPSGNWTWMRGSSAVDQFGTCGTQGVPDPANTPGARRDSVGWTDSAGHLWLFGGNGVDILGWDTYRMDLWQFGPVGSSSAVADWASY